MVTTSAITLVLCAGPVNQLWADPGHDEIYRTGYEAIRNVCMHSEATRLEVESDMLTTSP